MWLNGWPATLERNSRGVLTVGGCDLSDLAGEFGTPLYVVEERGFRSMAGWFRAEFMEAFEDHDAEAHVYYASHALLTSRIARWMRYEEVGLAIGSAGELEVALRGGVQPENIAWHANDTSDEELRRVLGVGVGRIVLGSMRDIEALGAVAAELGVVAPVMVRVATGVRGREHGHATSDHNDQRFGLTLARGVAMEALTACHRSPHLDLVGMHTHIGSQVETGEAFAESASRMLRLRAAFMRATGAELPEVCLGGGFPVRPANDLQEHEFAMMPHTIAKAMARTLEEVGDNWPRVSVEPGRAIATQAGLTLYRVGMVKRIELAAGGSRQYVRVDAGLGNPACSLPIYSDDAVLVASRPASRERVSSVVVGRHGEDRDAVLREVSLAADVARGDLLAVTVTGMHERAAASNYAMLMRPPVVSVRDGVATLHVRRDTVEDLLSWDIAPD